MTTIPQSDDGFAVRNSGVYRNLPTYPNVSGLTAIIPGATGISGWNTIRSLLDSPNRWTKVYAMSRSAPNKELMDLLSEQQRSRLQHLPVDFSSSAKEIAKALEPISELDPYVFFYAYLQPPTEEGEEVWSNVEKLDEVNSKLFSSFMEALEIADVTPKRIVLQTGGKNYGMQLGRAPQPSVESDPQPRQLGPNFYYAQEDSLTDYCKRHAKTSWNVIRPFGVMGSALKAQMSGLYLFCVFTAVQAHKKEPLYFPGDWKTWQGPTPMSTARLTGYLTEWAALHDKCKNQAYNSIDGNAMTFERFMTETARWYGIDAVAPPEDMSKYETSEMHGGKGRGYGVPLVTSSNYKMLDWAQKDCNKNAWREIMEASNGKITNDPFEEGAVEENFQLLDIFFSISCLASLNKARYQGWTGFADTLEAAFESVQEMVGMGLLPPMVADAARPMV